MEATLVWSPAWRVVRHGGDVVLSGGGDALFVLDQLPAGVAEAIEAAQATGTVEPGDQALAPFVDRLLALGAVEPPVRGARAVAAVVPLGPADEDGAAQLAAALGAWRPTGPLGAADAGITVVVRSGTEVGSVPAPLPLPRSTALLVDLGHEHTVSIGPWWAGPASSCPACYFGRLRHRWGDLPMPPAPDVGRWSAAVAALVAIQLEAIDAGRSQLVNAAISWDLRDGRSQRDAVLKVPWCATCGSVR